MTTLYPELEDYIYEYCSTFKTRNELMAGRMFTSNYDSRSEANRKAILAKGWVSEDPAVLEMIADGFPTFKRKVVQRIWQAHQHEIKLNLCPKCYKITRTPQARQCRFCFHSWH